MKKNYLVILLIIITLLSSCSNSTNKTTLENSFDNKKITVDSNKMFDIEIVEREEPTNISEGTPEWGIKLHNDSGYIYFIVSNSIKQQIIEFSEIDEVKNIEINGLQGTYYIDNSYGDNDDVAIQIIFDNELNQTTGMFSYGIISIFDKEYYNDNKMIINEIIYSFNVLD